MTSITDLFNLRSITLFLVIRKVTHVSPKDGKGRTITHKLFDSIRGTELEDRLAIVGTDGTACITGKHNGCIQHLVELVHRPLQGIVCLYHTYHTKSFLQDTFVQPLMVPKLPPIHLWVVQENVYMGLYQLGQLGANINANFFIYKTFSKCCQRLEHRLVLCL